MRQVNVPLIAEKNTELFYEMILAQKQQKLKNSEKIQKFREKWTKFKEENGPINAACETPERDAHSGQPVDCSGIEMDRKVAKSRLEKIYGKFLNHF